MALLLSPAKLVLLAVHCAVRADLASLAALAARHGAALRKDLLLRILLTYLPETVPSSQYAPFLQQLESGAFPDADGHDVDCSPVERLAEDEAAKKVRKLRLLPLAVPAAPDEPEHDTQDATALFLLRRSYRVDEEAGLLAELPGLLLPFLDHSPCMRTLLVSTILPLLRRNCEYYPHEPVPHTLHEFRQLPDRLAATLLLSQTGAREDDLPYVGRDLRGLVGPWLSDERRWKHGKNATSSPGDTPPPDADECEAEVVCPGWDEVLRWLAAQASKRWVVAVNAVQQWNGPRDVDLAGWGAVELSDGQWDYLEQSYARAALASAYLLPEPSIEALEGAYAIVAKISSLRHIGSVSPLASALAVLPPLTDLIPDEITSARNATYMRNHLLRPSNVLTAPTAESTAFLQALILSAHILTRAGCPCTVRRAGELALLQDEREQMAEAVKLIRSVSNNGPKTDDKFWVKFRNDVLWLRDWGAEDGWSSTETAPRGVFGQLKRDFLEAEILKVLLSNTRYTLARSIYEDAPDQPLDSAVLRDTIYATAMSAYDNASNPNRTRGGLKKCDDIIKAFPRTIQPSDPPAKRIEALLQATHLLNDYRLVLKQGEPFTPVVLRVHADPISIIGKILEQNPKSYTQIKSMLLLGTRMVEAGLTASDKSIHSTLTPEDEAAQRASAQRRITAMCIDAALTENDFETAYSYVINRLSPLDTSSTSTSTSTSTAAATDEYSWKAALQAGRYRRTAPPRPSRPTNLLGAAATPADAANHLRHLEQRLECLAAALRLAPRPALPEILAAFRRAEEELDAALREDERRDDEWDARVDALRPSAAGFPPKQRSAATGSAAAAAEEDAAPMSLFDLSRASVLSAQRNLSALSGLQRSAAGFGGGLGSLGGLGVGGGGGGARGDSGRNSLDQRSPTPFSAAGSTASGGSVDGADEAAVGARRVRKRDQLREAAMGTLVSGVGWLVGAPPPPAGGRE